MHPIEHLRHVARSRSGAPLDKAREAAYALACLSEARDLVIACRRIVERHPTVGQLWWLCSHLLVAGEPSARAWELVDALESDLTGELPDEAHSVLSGLDRDVVLVCASAIGPGRVLVPAAARSEIERAGAEGVALWCVATLGVRLPREYVDTIAERASGQLVDLAVGQITALVTPDGVQRDVAAALRPECPFTPELLRPSPI